MNVTINNPPIYMNHHHYSISFLSSIALVIVLLFSGFTTQQHQETLPNIALKDMNGNTVNILDYANNGKITIISFWATWCGPCIKELDNMNELYEDWVEEFGLELVAVSVDDARNVPKVKPLVNGKGWPYQVLLDENRDLSRALNVSNPPMTFLLNREGVVVYKHTGYTEGAEYKLLEEIKKWVK
jgi:cytochrome c biogenesis protein CcmG/thiol:disulfide interchange protein DsbE